MEHNTPDNVEAYYEEWTDRYVESFGTFFQALQTTNQPDLMVYIAKQIGLTHGMKVLDAGCGICGPAIALAERYDIDLEAITLSDVQVNYGRDNIRKANLKGRINLQKMDFHTLSDHFAPESFDAIYFLESLVHSHDPEKVIQEVRKVLKPQGVLYIKDLYKGPNNPVEPKYVEYAIQATNEQFCLKTQDIGDLLNLLVKYGFRINWCRTPEVEQNFDLGNAFTAKYLFRLRMDQEGPWRDEGFIFLHWMETMGVKHY